MSRVIYLASYDLYQEILEYQYPEGKFAILRRPDVTAPLSFGTFTREEDRVAGIFASPQGPVLFFDSRHLVGRLGVTTAHVEPSGKSRFHFTLTHEGRVEYDLDYQERLGIGTNPYDNEQEDVDLFAMLAAGLRKEQFFRAYVKDWAENSETM